VNQIPAHLLLGPAAPSTLIPTPATTKYNIAMFSSSHPQYIRPPPAEIRVIDEVLGGTDGASLLKLQKSAVEPLLATGQPMGYALGFFEQGIFIGLGIALTVILPTLGYGSWVVGSNGWRLLKARMA
jgi:aldehyde dehydrogenase (NAD+)